MSEYVSEHVYVTDGGLDEVMEHYDMCCREGIKPPLYVHRSLYEDFSKVTSVECECVCPCHAPKDGDAVLHIVACCEGRCATCGRWFMIGLKEHRETCLPPAEPELGGEG